MKRLNNYSIIISTCDKFSDLWDANIHLLNKNWSTRGADTYLVTDAETDRTFSDVEIVAAGVNTEITQRLEKAIEKINTEYVLFTLDDYFLTEKISTSAIQQALCFMDKEKIDYLRLYPASKCYLNKEGAVESTVFPGYYIRDISKGDYKISLYPGIWRVSFMKKTLEKVMNAWQYEVALTGLARKYHAKCAISNHREFPFLDVVRKGKILRKANRYFKKNPIYKNENRKIMKWREEWSINVRTFLRRYLPTSIFKLIKKIMICFGKEFYSPIE